EDGERFGIEILDAACPHYRTDTRRKVCARRRCTASFLMYNSHRQFIKSSTEKGGRMVRAAIIIFSACVLTASLLAGQPATVGDPLPVLTAEQLAAFEYGKDEFTQVESVAEGLGPVFNEASCAACHTTPSNGAIGGTNDRFETRFGRIINGTFDPMMEFG